jgi:hypothetical protein
MAKLIVSQEEFELSWWVLELAIILTALIIGGNLLILYPESILAFIIPTITLFIILYCFGGIDHSGFGGSILPSWLCPICWWDNFRQATEPWGNVININWHGKK